MRNLDISLLRTLIQVAECKSMTVAAKRLCITQGAVSQQLKRLEEMVNQNLLDRSSRNGIVLTLDGERLLSSAQKLLALNDDILLTIREVEITGHVRLGAPHDLMGTHLPAVLQSFILQYPGVNISLSTGSSQELRAAFRDGAVDIALLEEPADALTSECLSLEKLVWVGAVNGAARTRRPLPVCLVSQTCLFRSLLPVALLPRDIAWRSIIDYPSLEATSAAVSADIAVTALLASTVPDNLRILGTDDGLPELPELPEIGITLHVRDQGASGACLALAKAFREHYAGWNAVRADSQVA